ncbi:MAG: hypothetical protein J0L92_06115 [Deltaproteobacteria bacterium]|nr:hypothetical protein [Deltaproteobacteria bacterium]
MRTITTIAVALLVSLVLSPLPRAQACGGSYSMSPEDFVTGAAYQYLAQHEPRGTDTSWSVESVSIAEGTAHTLIRWNGRLHTLTLTEAQGRWTVTGWRARPSPVAPTSGS